MQNFSDIVLFNGQPLSGASVTVLNYPSGTVATIYVDNGITVGPNPITTNALGRYNFYAANGRYSLQISYPNTTTQTILDFPLEDDPTGAQPVSATSLTITGISAHNVLVGEASSPVVGIAPGAAGTALVSVGPSSDPAFGNAVKTVGGSVDNSPVGATTPSTGAFTTLAASGTVSGTGFSSYLASPPAIGGTAPSAGSFTTLSSTQAYTPSQTAGIIGTTTNNNANAGSWGEYITAAFATVSLSNNVNANATTISLTAGDWDVTVGGTVVGNTNVITTGALGVSTTSATFGAQGTFFEYVGPAITVIAGGAQPVRVSITSTTTVYAVALAAFASGTVTTSGFIRARRVR